MREKEQKKVREFKRKYHLKHVTTDSLIQILEQQGYTIILFNGVADDESVETLMRTLELGECATQSKCFTYRNDRFRLVFVHEDLTDEEKRIVLSHEEGHIWNGHMTQDSIFGEDVLQEYEANEFAHYLLKEEEVKRRKRGGVLALLVIFMLIGTAGFVHTRNIRERESQKKEFYITATGEKYHLISCRYIKGRDDIYRLTKDELESGRYEPCNVCKPDDQ